MGAYEAFIAVWKKAADMQEPWMVSAAISYVEKSSRDATGIRALSVAFLSSAAISDEQRAVIQMRITSTKESLLFSGVQLPEGWIIGIGRASVLSPIAVVEINARMTDEQMLRALWDYAQEQYRTSMTAAATGNSQ